MTYHSIKDYLEAIEVYNSTFARIENGRMRLLVKGRWVSKEEFDANNSKPIYVPEQKSNPDGKTIYRGVISPKR